MHMCISNATAHRAYPLFGLNAPDRRGALLVTARSGSDSGVIAVLPFAPTGDVDPQTQCIDNARVDGSPLVMSVLAAESGFLFDGVALSDVAYLYFDSDAAQTIDVSFVENRLPVEIGRSWGHA